MQKLRFHLTGDVRSYRNCYKLMEFQGRPVRRDQIEFFQDLVPEILVAAIIGYLIALVIARKHLKIRSL